MRVAPGAARLRLVLAGMVGFLAEVIGVHAGYPFGGYHYTNALDPRFLDVPLVMCCAWIVVVAYAQALSAQVALDQPMRTIAGALWLTGLDLLIDPLAAGPLSYWEWHSSGRYYGIPATNFAGWLLVSAIALVAAGPARTVSRTHLNLGISIVIFFVLIAAAMGMVLAVAVGIVLVGVHAFTCCAPRARAPLG